MVKARKFKFSELLHRIEELVFVRAIRDGLIHIIPILIIGAFALILQTFPVPGYKEGLETFAGGFFLKLFQVIYSATFGVLSVYMTVSLSRAYMKLRRESIAPIAAAIVASLLSFFIFAGAYVPGFGLDQMGPKSMFLAILTGLGASAAFRLFYHLLSDNRHQRFLIGGDHEFNKMVSVVIPVAIVALAFGLLNTIIVFAFQVDSFRTLLANLFNALFSVGPNGFLKGFFFVMLSSILWFFGIHGSDTLEGVMQSYFVPGLAANQAAVAAGAAPTEILTKEFFDCFVLMGGCGTTIALLIAILAFSRNRNSKRLGLTATVPMLFNINELMVFGLPIIFNPVLLIPFILVPLINYSIAYLAVFTGIVPMITSSVEWTTPVFLGGYFATGSIAGSVLQLVNILVSVAIYLPFVRMLDRQNVEKAQSNFDEFMTFFRDHEANLASRRLLEMVDIHGDYAKDLCNDIRYRLEEGLCVAYQPQYQYDGRCIGVECLLRFKHPTFGFLYPPLVIKLAEEGGFLPELEEMILTRALSDRPKVLEKYGQSVKLSVNVTGTTIVTERYLAFCQKINEEDPFAGKNVCIELTEQAAISFNEATLNALKSFHNMGIMLAIDDFSMGQTSIHYLSDNMFNIIKLDGSLVDGIFTHKNTADIVASIISLAQSLNMTVIAEFVDSQKKKEALHEIGCDIYQGYLYSPAVFLANPADTSNTK